MDLSAALQAPPTGDRPRFAHGSGRLRGSRCRDCGETSWPGRVICNRCGSTNVAAEEFATSGTLLTHTTVWVPRAGLEPGYSLGLVRLDDGPSVFTHVRGLPAEARMPLPVRLVLAESEAALPPFWVEPAESEEEGRDDG
jgi:uncharacterized OB-fold protein